jgi:enoyl-CoA hydratase
MTDLAALSYHLDGDVAILTLDDGKANAVSPALLEALNGALDRARDEARAVVLAGRPGKFSAGFDLSVMTRSTEAMRDLVQSGAELLLRWYEYDLPTVAACTGHALAAGALLLLTTDVRIGSDSPAKIGLNEVAIGMPLPIFAVEFARDRLTKKTFTQATMGACVFSPEEAAVAGYLDRVVPADTVLDEAVAEARRLATLSTGAYARTKHAARQATIDHVRATLADDMAKLTGPTPP